MHQIFVEHWPAEGGILKVEGEERHYLGRSLRARPGEVFRLAAQNGQAALGTLQGFEGDWAVFKVGQAHPDPVQAWQVSLLLCPPRGEALDHALEMATQLGVQQVGFLRSERTQVNFESGALAAPRMEKRLREACRQCLRAKVPGILPLRDLRSALNDSTLPNRILLSERGGQALSGALPPKGAGLTFLVGPEGGFSDLEHQEALAAGWSPVSLGPLILKVPTAVAAALGTLQSLACGPGEGQTHA